MFNALNRFISRLDGETSTLKENHGSFGFQVLRNTNLGLHIEPWFDFVVGINGRIIDDSDPGLFAQEVRNCAGNMVCLGLWSAKGQRTRALHVPVPTETASLGLTLQWTPLTVASNIWHVLDVPANCPADVAGLLPYGDYILGTPEGTLHGEGGLSELVEDHIGRPLKLYVYNNEYDVAREVTIRPSRDWGGPGIMGCELGYGALHRLPPQLSEPLHGPGETLFESGVAQQPGRGSVTYAAAGESFVEKQFEPVEPSSGGGGQFVVPALLTAGSPPAARSKKKDRHAHGGANPSLMDDYFAEQEKRSRELEVSGSEGTHTASFLPPPPPKRGPPQAAPLKAGTAVPDEEIAAGVGE